MTNQSKTKIKTSSVILLISIFFPPEIGGGSTGAWNRVMAFHKLGYSVFILGSIPTYPSGKVLDPKYKGKIFYTETIDSFVVIRLRNLPLEYAGFAKRLIIFSSFTLLALFYMPKILKITGTVDIIYARSPVIFSSIIGFAYSKFTKSFFIYEAADLWPEEFVAFKSPLLPIIIAIGKVAANLSYKLPNTIVTISKLASYHISKEYKPKASVYSIHVGVDPCKFPRLSKSDSRTELIGKRVFHSSFKGKFIVLYSGLLSSSQQIENLAYAADKLKDEKDIAILVIGEGEEKEKLQQLKQRQDLHNFHLLPAQCRNIMPTIISAADVCLILLAPEQIFRIAIPVKFYEYLSCCRPIIAVCQQGELTNIINSHNIGQSIIGGDIDGLANIIKDYRNSPILLQTLEKNCYITLQRFSLDSIVYDFENLLKKETRK